MYVHDELNVCFLASPRTGSRSWRDCLLKIGFRAVGAHHMGPREGMTIETYTTFSIVRNPWDTMLSWWFYRHGPQYEPRPSLDWAARFVSANSHIKAGELWYHRGHSDFLVNFEGMESKYRALMIAWGVDSYPPLSHVGRSLSRHRRPYQEYYDHDVRRFIGWAFEKETLELGYEFNEVVSQ